VPLTQIDIPPAVYQCVIIRDICAAFTNAPIQRENLKHEKQISLPTPTRSSIFGVPLEDLMGYNGEKGSVPRVVKDCIQYLRESGTFLYVSESIVPKMSCNRAGTGRTF
jgi:Rho GTPase-activating protein 1